MWIFDTISAGTCATLAQVMPVFLVAFVAQDVVRSRQPMRMVDHLTVGLRTILDAVLVGALFALEIALVIGVQSDGIQTRGISIAIWVSSLYVAIGVLARWATLQPWLRNQLEFIWKATVWIGARVWPSRDGREVLRSALAKWERLSAQYFVVDDRGQMISTRADGTQTKSIQKRPRSRTG